MTQRASLTASAAAITFGLTYVLVDFAKLPRLFYHPHEHTWRFARDAGGPVPMGYVGLWAWAFVAALVVGAIVHLATRAAPSPKLLGLMRAWSLTALGFAAAYTAWHNWP